MQYNIDNIINKARRDFGIEEFPGNFFEYIIQNQNYIERYKLALFKQNLGEDNSGFICYTDKGTAFICINYYRTLGHQNFTLAHEIGHMYLHKGVNYDDTDESIKVRFKKSCDVESEANTFASEFLYPIEYVQKDIKIMEENNLLEVGNEIAMGEFINEIAMRHCISFRFALLRILFNSEFSENNCVLKKAENILQEVGSLRERYDKEFYSFGQESRYCRPYIGILNQQKRLCDILLEKEELGLESAKAINRRLEELEGLDETFI